jgi:hypothetical protein
MRSSFFTSAGASGAALLLLKCLSTAALSKLTISVDATQQMQRMGWDFRMMEY